MPQSIRPHRLPVKAVLRHSALRAESCNSTQFRRTVLRYQAGLPEQPSEPYHGIESR